MKTLRNGSKGPDVKRWQFFLIGQGFDAGVADGIFGGKTEEATKAFQAKQKLTADGVAGNRTIAKAMLLGFEIIPDDRPEDERTSPNWPPKPGFPPLVSTAERQRLFGRYTYTHRPIPGNRENIEIHPPWEADNIVAVHIPQLIGVKGAPRSGNIRVHRHAAEQFRGLWQAWEDAGLLDRVLTWEGSYVPRLVRGGTSLSNHAFGTAFDINAKWNGLGALPALTGKEGSVRELVSAASDLGFYWGGHFNRRDGMHFEVAQLRE